MLIHCSPPSLPNHSLDGLLEDGYWSVGKRRQRVDDKQQDWQRGMEDEQREENSGQEGRKDRQTDRQRRYEHES